MLSLIYLLNEWSESNKKKKKEDQANKIDTADTSVMIDTEPAKEAISLLLKSATVKLNEREFVVVRDFLIARIGLENGQRPRPFETVRVRDFERLEEKEDTYVMCVTRHKMSKAEPTPLTLSANVKSNLEAYIKNVRPHFAKQGEEAIFVTTSGEAFSSGTIGRRITSWWRKATGKEKMTSTRLRKIDASGLHLANDIDKRSAHKLMCHSTQTVERYYMIHDLGDVAVHGHSVLKQNIKLKDTVKTDVTGLSSQSKQSSPGKSEFSSEQLDDIDLLFADIIKQNKPLSMKDARNIMSERTNFMEFVNDDSMVRKVLYRVKYLQGKCYKDNLKELDEQESQSRTTSWLTSSSGEKKRHKRRQWAEEDHKEIEKAFSSYKAVIFDEFRSNANLAEIADRNGLERCYEKVKTLFKQRK